MALITAGLIQALNTGFRDDFQRGLADAQAEVMWTRIATEVPSVTASNTYGWLGDMPQLREWIGDRQVRDIKEHGYQIVNKSYEGTVGVKRTLIEDDQFGMYRPIMQGLGTSAARLPDELLFGLLKNGHANLCHDQQFFFDTDHPVYPNVDGTGTAITVGNVATGSAPAWYLLDVNNVLRPFIWQSRKKPELVAMTASNDEQVFTANEFRYGVDMRGNAGYAFWQLAYKSQAVLDEDGYAAARAAMMNVKTDGLRPLNVRPSLLIVPPALEKAARNLLLKDKDGGNPWYGSAELLVTQLIS